jgi:DNA primase
MVDWKDEVARLDIAEVAEKLGLQIAPGRRTPRIALCPFHEDSTPSLRLYRKRRLTAAVLDQAA